MVSSSKREFLKTLNRSKKLCMKKVNPSFLFKVMQYRVKMTEQVIVAHKNSLIKNGH